MSLPAKFWLLAFLLFGLSRAANAENHLDGKGELAWSPDGVWVAFNWPNEDELVIVNTEAPRVYALRPVGDVKLDTELVVSAAPPKSVSGPAHKRLPRLLPSPGRGRLQPLGWAPDSRTLVYRCARGERALFDVERGMVTAREPVEQLLPWEKERDRRVRFQLITRNGGPHYIMQVINGDGEMLRQLQFVDQSEVFLLSGARSGSSTFLAPDGRSLIYPRHEDGQWYLIKEPVQHDASKPVRLLVGEQRPLHWQLAAGNGQLAVVTRQELLLGGLEDWEARRSMPLRGAAVQLQWSTAGDWLAIEDQQTLWVWRADAARPQQVSVDCAPRFWGWRAGRLLFGSARTSIADLRIYRPGERDEPEPLVKAPGWQTAPRFSAVSPDGRKLAAVVHFLDAASRTYWQLWATELGNGGDWELLLGSRELEARRR